MSSVPDLAAFHHVNDIIVVAPDVLHLAGKRTGQVSGQLFTTAQLPEMVFVGYNLSVEVVHGRYFVTTNVYP